MRLRQIRLAGFKSFVDPTTISFPSELIGIVGPNGCGKSNIIDAVRWVMGESSAKQLRGDSMADVVFNGSTTRKPAVQASVELIFDNSDGKLGGRYAAYESISVKRQVSRDSQSAYFLNGAKCRRRDITDIFLGTGLGPRSYAIIEQDMITRLIDAKPDELREFIEEAAGISKYKERRRETETRIRHTQENLDRLNDIRDELEKRLTHLKRQATMAEKYKVFKEEQRERRAELLALRWQRLDEEVRRQDTTVAEQDTALEAAVAEQRRSEAELEKQRAEQTAASDAFNEIYRQVLEAGAEIARVEETIQNLRRRREELQASLEREDAALQDALSHLDGEQQRRAQFEAALAEDEPELASLESQAHDARTGLERSETAMQAWQAELESLSEAGAEPTKIAHAERARIEQLDEQLTHFYDRVARLESEQAVLDVGELESVLATLGEQLQQQEVEQGQSQQSLDETQVAIRSLRESLSQLSNDLHGARETCQEKRGRLASLQALQQDALGKRRAEIVEWLRDNGLESSPRLAERLSVDAGWERALEVVLGAHLEAVCHPLDGGLAPRLGAVRQGVLTLFDESEAVEPTAMEQAAAGFAPRLSDKVSAPGGISHLLHGIYTAAGLDEALRMRSRLGVGESCITPEGFWIGVNWSRATGDLEEGAGVLAREQEIKALLGEIDVVQNDVDRLQAEFEASRERLRDAEDGHAELQAEIARRQRAYAGLRSEVAGKEAQLAQARQRGAEVLDELNSIQGQKAAAESALSAARQRLESSTDEMERLSTEREAWSAKREQHRGDLEQARSRWQAVRDDLYQVGVRVESTRAQLESLEDSAERNKSQVTMLEGRCEELRTALTDSDEPIAEAQANLDERLSVRSGVEQSLKAARSRVEETEATVRELDQARHSTESKVEEQRQKLEQIKLSGQETRVRRKTLEEQLAESEAQAGALLEALPEDASESAWEEQLDALERRIARLGPINLAAIDEYTQQSERKEYLDAQHSDLVEALSTLEEAIRKIDRETRARFKETYESVNAGFTSLFPRLFGGGRASLQMIGDDLLSTGITIMAQPPGKRNSTIHLLSGGEKALTAVAMVFAIFGLNPAPFCLLDEVDAPLDDANVGRFGELVKDMSDKVQFLLVTHNKGTMETAHQLIGVTMNEPGVSRLVAVDLDEAVELAG